jgi:hypothetical protein
LPAFINATIGPHYVNQKLKAWIMRKYKRFRLDKTGASLFLRKVKRAALDAWAKHVLTAPERSISGNNVVRLAIKSF